MLKKKQAPQLKFFSKFTDDAGMSIPSVLVAASIVSILFLGVGSFFQNARSVAKQVQRNRAGLAYEIHFSMMSSNKNAWLQIQQKKESILNSCLSVQGPKNSPNKCPEIVANNADINKVFQITGNSLFFSEMTLYSSLGDKIAGTPSAPFLISSEGTACTTNCPFKVTGYMSREVAATDAAPQSVSFYALIESNESALQLGSLWLKPTAKSFTLGTVAAMPANTRATKGQCNANEDFIGFDSFTGSSICRTREVASCPVGQFFLGLDASLQPICYTITPPPPPTPPAPVVAVAPVAAPAPVAPPPPPPPPPPPDPVPTWTDTPVASPCA